MVMEKIPDFKNLNLTCSNLMEEMFEDTSMTIWAIVVYIFNMPVGSVLWFLVIHYERFGGDPMKRSISNKLLSSAALVKLLGGFVIENIFLAGTFFGCLPHFIGISFVYVRNVKIYAMTSFLMIYMVYKCFLIYSFTFASRLNDEFVSLLIISNVLLYCFVVVNSELYLNLHLDSFYNFLTCQNLQTKSNIW